MTLSLTSLILNCFYFLFSFYCLTLTSSSITCSFICSDFFGNFDSLALTFPSTALMRVILYFFDDFFFSSTIITCSLILILICGGIFCYFYFLNLCLISSSLSWTLIYCCSCFCSYYFLLTFSCYFLVITLSCYICDRFNCFFFSCAFSSTSLISC